MEFKSFFGEPEDCNSWSQVYQAQLSTLGYVDTLKRKKVEKYDSPLADFDENRVDPNVFQTACQVWCSLTTSGEGMAAEIVQSAEYPSEAWTKLVRHDRASGLKERCRLTVEFYTVKMELREYPTKFPLRVDRMLTELELVDWPVDLRMLISLFSAD